MKYLTILLLLLPAFASAQHAVEVVTKDSTYTYKMRLETIHCDINGCKREGEFFESQYIPCSGYISRWYCKKHYRRVKK